ncbi:MAG: response regulator [bacterium]|nr:MAG: response regulator [bacterium]
MADPRRTRILIVDDEENIRHLLRLAFEEEFEVIEATHGMEAFELAVKEKPDIILSDIMMPRLDGYGLYRKVKSRPDTATIPFVFLSAKKDVDERVEGLEMGADDYITKPFSIKELKAKVRSITKKVSDIHERGSLEGLLKEVDLVDVIQLIEMGRKTGMLLLESQQRSGKVYFNKGLPIYAQAGRFAGVEAFHVMLAWKEGRFRLDQKAVSIEPNIDHTGGQELLMEGVRLSDEMEEAMRRLPPPDTVLFLERELSGAAADMVATVEPFGDGVSIAQAAALTALPPYLFYPLLDEAIRQGYLGKRTDTAGKSEMLRQVKAALERL